MSAPPPPYLALHVIHFLILFSLEPGHFSRYDDGPTGSKIRGSIPGGVQ
jgi:hypothetical protein